MYVYIYIFTYVITTKKAFLDVCCFSFLTFFSKNVKKGVVPKIKRQEFLRKGEGRSIFRFLDVY